MKKTDLQSMILMLSKANMPYRFEAKTINGDECLATLEITSFYYMATSKISFKNGNIVDIDRLSDFREGGEDEGEDE